MVDRPVNTGMVDLCLCTDSNRRNGKKETRMGMLPEKYVRKIKCGLVKFDYQSYSGYLQSEHWRSVRRRYWASDLGAAKRCAGCQRGDVRLSLHHRSYKHLGDERLTDLIQVCDDCHLYIHQTLKRVTERNGDKPWRGNLEAITGMCLKSKRRGARRRSQLAGIAATE